MLINGVDYSWSQPLCDTCFAGFAPRVREPVRVAVGHRERETCAMCGCATRSGLYLRIDPREVYYPRRKDGS